MSNFKALLVSENSNGSFSREIVDRAPEDLPDNSVHIKVQASSLNYKDALSATGNKGVSKNYPFTPGIDATGTVAHSDDPKWKSGDEVIVTGYGLGMTTPGGFGELIKVPSDWVVPKPVELTFVQAMTYGTAGFTAAQGISWLKHDGIEPEDGPIIVTGASGGVGCLAVAMLAKLGYHVVASTGKLQEKDFLISLGAKEIIERNALSTATDRPMLKGSYAGAIDTVGGSTLENVIKSTKRRATVTCCGLVASPEIQLTVFPFILRGVKLVGIDSAECPMDMRLNIWKKLSDEWRPDCLDEIRQTCRLSDINTKIDAILKGQVKGRVVLKHHV